MPELNDEGARSEKARWDALWDKWVGIMGLNDWTIKTAYHRREHDPEAVAVINVQWYYMEAVVDVYLPTIATRPDSWLEEDVIHEMAHCLTDRLARPNGAAIADDTERHLHDENLVTMISKAVRRAYYKGGETPSKVPPTDNV